MRLLVVEDFPQIRKALVQGLREADYAVDATGDGNEALWYARTSDYDAMVLDLMLPGMSGLDVLREMRRSGRDTPVLILTARDAVDDRVKGLDAGADDYLVKPFAFEELLARIRALLRRGYNDADERIVVGPLELDTTYKRASLDGKPVALTAREFALLEYLARRRGQPVSRTDIWEHLYDADADHTSNVVDVYIGYLRKKLHRAGEPSLIRTHRGMGYALEGPS